LLFAVIAEPSLAEVSQEAQSVSNEATEVSENNEQQSLKAESQVIADAPAAEVGAETNDEAKSRKGDSDLGYTKLIL